MFPLVNKLDLDQCPKNSFSTKIVFFPMNMGKLLIKMKEKKAVWWFMPVIPTSKRLSHQEDFCESEANLSTK